MPQFTPRFSAPSRTFRPRHGRSDVDSEFAVFVTEFPTGVRDFEIRRQLGEREFEQLNPLELLDSVTAVSVLDMLRGNPDKNPNSWVLSRLLVQCLEYTHNRRHLVSNHWDTGTLQGVELTQIANNAFARDLQAEQAREFELVRGGSSGDFAIEADYWGTFTALPPVEDRFQSAELAKLCDQLCERLSPLRSQEGEVEISELRQLIAGCWTEHFRDFDLPTAVRDRRKLFRKLMSVAVRQTSSLMERIGFAMVLRVVSDAERENGVFRSDRERKLFDLRYGACEALDGINIGFLYDCGDLHANLINSLASALVADDSDSAWQEAEKELRQHVHLLGQARLRATMVESEKKRQQRESRPRRLPRPRTDSHENADSVSAPQVLSYLMQLKDHQEELLPELKPGDRVRVQALFDEENLATAAEFLGLSKSKYRRQLRETVIPNVKRAMKRIEQRDEAKGVLKRSQQREE